MRDVRIGLIGLLAMSLLGAAEPVVVMESGQLREGFGMGVDASGDHRTWVSSSDGAIRANYPSGRSWGVVFVTVGEPTDPPRPGRDFSRHSSLVIEMRSIKRDARVSIGVKSKGQPDNGSETKVPIVVGEGWQTFRLPLDKFAGSDLRNLYVVAEVVFGTRSAEVEIRSIRYE